MRSRELSTAVRGQTLQDYALGIGVFLLTVFVVLTLIMPSMLAPFQDDVDSDAEAQADRVANTIINNASVSGRLNALNVTIVENLANKDIDELRSRFELPRTSWVNVSVETMNGSRIIRSSNGDFLNTNRDPEATGSAASARIVTLSDGSCKPACRLIVRVW